jgi:hypothetical protein
MASPPMWKAKPPSSQPITRITTIMYIILLMIVEPVVSNYVSYIDNKEVTPTAYFEQVI